LWRRFSAAGRRLIESTYDWNSIGSQVAEMYSSLLRGQRAVADQGRTCMRVAQAR